MSRLPRIRDLLVAVLSVGFLAFPFSAPAQSVETGSPQGERPVVEISEQPVPPSVRAMAPIDEKNLLFLDQEGRVGVAKFSPGLSLIGWEFYSEVKWNALPDLALGPNGSVLVASPREITQAFDSDGSPGLDFFQSIVNDWAGRDEGVVITAGPVADSHGRLLFALSPLAAGEEKPLATLVSWEPGAEELVVVTESQLPIADFALGADGLLAARLRMPEYKDGIYISLTELPSPEQLAEDPESIPQTFPSLLLPADFTEGGTPTQLSFFRENRQEKLAVICPESRQFIEIVPEKSGGIWQGALLLRRVLDSPFQSILELAPGKLLGAGESGFFPLDDAGGPFRIHSIERADDGFVLSFTEPLDRATGSKPESYSVQSIRLADGQRSNLTARPVIESDGLSVILRIPPAEDGTVLRVRCRNVTSESGVAPLNPSVFYTVHKR